jgi:subtilisin family serine protease
MNQVSRRSYTKSLSTGAVLGAALLLCLTAMLAMAPAAFSAPSRAPYIVVLKDDVAHPANVARRHEANRGAEVGHIYGVAIKGYSADLTPGELKAIKQDPNVDYVERDGIIRPKGQAVGNQLKRVYAAQNPQLDIDETDDARVDVDIAILDTGVYEHPDLNVVSRVNCVEYSGAGPCKAGVFNDDHTGHGTHVAGDAAAIDNGIGMVGTAPGARIWSVKVINRMGYAGTDEVGRGIGGLITPDADLKEGNAKMSDAIAGINWVTINSSAIEVANMSFACETTEWGCARTALAEAIATSVNNGVVWVAAAGQGGMGVANNIYHTRHYPALLSDVITVSAMADYDGLPGSLSNSNGCPLEKGFQHDDRLMGLGKEASGFPGFVWGGFGSNYGPEVDMTAPGSCVFSTWSPWDPGQNAYGVPSGSEYGFMYGSSVASALVAGAAADIAAQYNPNNRADVEKIRAALLGAGNLNWEDLHDDPIEGLVGDGTKEPLLDLPVTPLSPGAPPPPPPPPAPTVSLLTFTGITQETATLKGTVNMNGPDGRYWFQCASEGGHNFETPETYVAPGSGTVNVEYALSGLEWGMNYHCRMTANSENGYTNGPDQVFTTKPGPVFETLPATEATKSKITMAAKIDTKGSALSYHFEYGNLQGYGWETETKTLPAEPSGFQQVTASVSGLPVGWTLHDRIVVKVLSKTMNGQDRVATTAWSNETSVAPSGAKSDGLNDISCAAGGSCMAVGSLVNSAGATVPAAEKWNGAAWALATPPAPAGSPSELKGVSCATTTACMAVGYKQVSGAAQPLATQWNGSAWAETSPAPAGPAGYRSYFTDVACTAANSCEAVGYSVPTSGAEIIKTLVSHWNGSTWAIKASANPNTPGGEPSQEDNKLEGVSCASATVCVAVGAHYRSFGEEQINSPLIERLSGAEWVNQEAAPVSGVPNAWLNGVSCPTTTWCMAVGSKAYSPTGPFLPLTERWTGSAWVNNSPGVEANGAGQLTGVSCTSPGACRTVSTNSRAMHFEGLYWKTEAPQAPANSDSSQAPRLWGVSCPTPAECHVVGNYTDTSAYTGRLAQGWSGAGVVPVASLGFPANVGEKSVTLRGSIDAGGVDTTYYFEYGPTVSYGTKTPVANAGSWAVGMASGQVEAATAVTGLQPGTTYHYRLVATNGSASANGPDYAFETRRPVLGEMPSTEVFNGGSTAISDFATKWSAPTWVSSRKGKNNANGWGPTEGAPSAAYFLGTVSDTGKGVGAAATMASAPGTGLTAGLWLDLQSGTTKNGYNLVFEQTAASVYTVTLKKWNAGVATTLASATGVPLANGNSFAIVDNGGTVLALTDTGNGFAELLSASDSAFSGGYTGVEANSTAVRLTKFKVGTMAEKAASFEAALKAVPVTDGLSRTESPLSLGGSWSALSWDTATPKTGQVVSTGWGPAETTSSIFGASWKAMASDTGTGDIVTVTNNIGAIGLSGYYTALWLNAPNPGTAKSGYQVRISEVGPGSYEAKLVKWVAGVATTLGTKSSLPLGGTGKLTGAKFALVDKGGTVSVWTAPFGGVFTQAISVADSTYSYGYGGVEGVGGTRLIDFKLGQLPLY